MLTVKVTANGDGSIAELEGRIDESFQLATDLPNPGKKVDFRCMHVTRINSIGVKKWLLYFQSLDKARVSYRFHELSSALVEQFNLISNFGANGEVVSVSLPYTCGQCTCSFGVVMPVTALRQAEFSVPEQVCPKCKAPGAAFDDIEEEYFKFLATQSKG